MAKSPKTTPARPVTRAEFSRVLRLLDERAQMIADLQHRCEMQLQRMAQMQAQLDRLDQIVERRLAKR